MKMKYSAFIILYLFLYIYLPPLFPINILHILTIYSFFSLVTSYKTIYPKLIIKTSIITLIIPLFVAVLYMLCVLLISQNSYMVVYPYLLMIIEIPICVIYLCSYFIKHEYDIYDVLNVLLIVGSIQGIISVLSFFIPAFKDVIIYNLMKRKYVQGYDYVLTQQLYRVRLNGLSSALTFTMPVVQTLLSLISLYLALNKKYKYIFFVPLLLFSAIVNARSSFIVLLYGGLILILMLAKNTKSLLKILMTVTMAIIIIPLVMQIVSNTSEGVAQWISDGLNETITFTQGEETGYYSVASENYIKFPEGLSIVFGTGKNIFGLNAGSGSDSDIGYINDIWQGGLIFISIAYFSFISYYIKAYKNGDKMNKFIVLLLIATFLIINIKGPIVSNNEFINFSILLNVIIVLNKNTNSSKLSIEKNKFNKIN